MPLAIQRVQTVCRVQIYKPHATCIQPVIVDCINNRNRINLAEVSRVDKSVENVQKCVARQHLNCTILGTALPLKIMCLRVQARSVM